MTDIDEKKVLKQRYNSLINRSFDLLLRYKLYSLIDEENLDINNFTISNNVKEEFSCLYIKSKRSELKEVNKKYNDFCKNKQLIRDYKKNYKEKYFKPRMSIEQFSTFWKTKINRCCAYCGLKETQIINLYVQTKRFYSRGKTMEVDKVNPNGEYELGNIVLACYWCNNAKSDEYTLDEFKNIAKGVNAIWNKRLLKDIVIFPEETYLTSGCQ